ncbi:ARID DNA-binding domain-containing protein, partial [Tanacetum coccineum]
YLNRSLPGPIPPVVNGVEIHLFDLYKLIENLGGYLSVHFCQEFDMVGEIMGLPKGNGEEIKRCYMNFLEVLISHFKTARAPRQGHNDALVEPAWKAEKDKDCLGHHQWNFGKDGAHMTRPAVLRGKKTMEHFIVKLEDTTDSQEQPTLPYYREDEKEDQNSHKEWSTYGLDNIKDMDCTKSIAESRRVYGNTIVATGNPHFYKQFIEITSIPVMHYDSEELTLTRPLTNEQQLAASKEHAAALKS